jgi:hypothetical protein
MNEELKKHINNLFNKQELPLSDFGQGYYQALLDILHLVQFLESGIMEGNALPANLHPSAPHKKE